MTILETRGLTVEFGGLTAVHDLDLTLAEGEILGLIGPNGAGKTTTFNAISGFQRPSRGEVLYRGQRISGLGPSHIARLGVIRTFQITAVFSQMTVAEAVRIGYHRRIRHGLGDVILRTRRYREEEAQIDRLVDEVLALTGLTRLRDAQSDELPCGDQRLLEIAIALQAAPDLLLLDEPAAGLNTAESEQLASLIREIRSRGITVLLVEHNMPMVMNLCDRILVLNYGELIAAGSPDAVVQNETVIKAYLGGASHA